MISTYRLSAFAARYEQRAYALLRIVGGFMFACHGAQKLFGLFGARSPAVGSQLWVGGAIELVTGALIALGLFTRGAAFLAAGTMAVAYTQYHWKLAFDGWRFLPIVNKGELAALYCFFFLYVVARGAGGLALDRPKRP
jgi:putative oxidoreductase